MKNRLLIYGATGFTGRLIALEAKRAWLEGGRDRGSAWQRPPVLAGRDAAKLTELAEETGLPWVAVELDDRAGMDRALADAAVVLNAAGPYQSTAVPMVKACLRTGTHYLDVSGDYEVVRRLDDYNIAAIDRAILVMPAVGFTVVASDYLVKLVRNEFKDKNDGLHTLRIALSHVDFVSRGSMRSLIEAARESVSVRRNGKLISVPIGQLERNFTFGDREQPSICAAVRLADLATAPKTTEDIEYPQGEQDKNKLSKGVPNIETYAEANGLQRLLYQAGSVFALPMQIWPLKQLINGQLRLWPEGPTQSDRESARQTVVVEGEDRMQSRVVACRLHTRDAYEFTAQVSVAIAGFVLEEKNPKKGFQTPAGAFFEELRLCFTSSNSHQGVTISPAIRSGLMSD